MNRIRACGKLDENGIVGRLLDTADGAVDALNANANGLPDDLDGDGASDTGLGGQGQVDGIIMRLTYVFMTEHSIVFALILSFNTWSSVFWFLIQLLEGCVNACFHWCIDLW